MDSCNMESLDDVDTVVLAYFRDIKRRVERVGWISSTPLWVEIPVEKEDGKWKL